MSTQPIRALLIENVPFDAELVRRALLKEGSPPFEVEHVGRLDLGLERLAKGGIDIVVLDLGLPDSQGLKTFTRLQEQAPGVPVVILTGSYKEDAIAVEAVKGGAQDFLTKDRVDGMILSRVMRYAIERKQTEAALQAANRELKMKLDHVAWLNQIVMERENIILDLKREVDSLLKTLGRSARYQI